MEFRWIVFLVLWTCMAGPVLSRPVLPVRPQVVHAEAPKSTPVEESCLRPNLP